MLKILLCLQKKKKKIRNITILHFFYYSQLSPFYTGRTIRSIVSTEKVESIHLFMNEKYLARVNRERSWSSPWGGCPCFPLPPFPFPSIFARIPLSLSPPPLPSHSREIYRQWREVPNGIQSADIVVTVRQNMRENRDEEEAVEEEASQFKFTPQTLSSAAKCTGNEECILAGFRPYFFE